MDFTAIVGVLAENSPLAVAGLTAVAALLILPGVARWGYDKVIGWFSADDDRDEVHEAVYEDDWTQKEDFRNWYESLPDDYFDDED